MKTRRIAALCMITRTLRLTSVFYSSFFVTGMAAAAAIGTPLTAEIPVSSSNGIGPSGSARVAIDAADNFTIAWLEDIRGGGGIQARLYHASGAPLTAALDITPGERANNRFGFVAPVAVSKSSTGQTVIAWSGRTDFIQQADTIFASVFNAAGTPVQTRIPVSATANDGSYSKIYAPSVAFVSSNEFVVAWVFERFTPFFFQTVGTNTSTIYARRFDLNGIPLGEESVVRRITAPLPSGFIGPALRIAVSPTGGYSIAHSERGQLAGGRDDESLTNSLVHIRRYGSDGRAATPDMSLSISGDGSSLASVNEFGLSYLVNGDLALVYAVPDKLRDSSLDTLFTRRYSPAGIPRGKAVQVAIRGKRWLGNPISLNLAPIPSGGYVVAWPDNDQNLSFAQYFAADGSAIGPTFTIGQGPEVNVVTTASGSLLASYGSSMSNISGDIFARLFAGP